MSFDDMDPMFRIGMMLGNAYGNIWANNATKRQEKRADKIFDDMQNANEVARIAQMRNANIADETATDVVADKLAQQAGTQGAQQATGMNLGVLKGVDYLGQADKYAQPQDQYQLSVPSPLEQLKQSQVGGKDYSVNKALQANQKAIQANEAQQAGMTPQQRAAASFDPTLTTTSLRKKLRDAGIAQDVIDERMKEYSKTIAEKARAYYQPGILKDMYYGMDVADGKGGVQHIPPNAATQMSALMKIQEYAKYDPEGAEYLTKGIISPTTFFNITEEDRKYKRNRADKLADDKSNREFQREMKNVDQANYLQRIQYAQQVKKASIIRALAAKYPNATPEQLERAADMYLLGASGSNSKKKSLTSSDDDTSTDSKSSSKTEYGGQKYKMAVEEAKNIEAIPDEERTPAQARRLKTLQNYINETGEEAIPSPKTQQESNNFVGKMLAKGHTPSEILAASGYEPGSEQFNTLYDSILNNSGAAASGSVSPDQEFTMPTNSGSKKATSIKSTSQAATPSYPSPINYAYNGDPDNDVIADIANVGNSVADFKRAQESSTPSYPSPIDYVYNEDPVSRSSAGDYWGRPKTGSDIVQYPSPIDYVYNGEPQSVIPAIANAGNSVAGFRRIEDNTPNYPSAVSGSYAYDSNPPDTSSSSSSPNKRDYGSFGNIIDPIWWQQIWAGMGNGYNGEPESNPPLDYMYNPSEDTGSVRNIAKAKDKPSGGTSLTNYYSDLLDSAEYEINEGYQGIRYSTSGIVNRMRDACEIIPYKESDGTNCARTVGAVLKNTPYAGMYNVDQFIDEARKNGELYRADSGYVPKAGDLAVTDNGDHIVMVTEKGGTIQNGKSHNGVYEVKKSPEQQNGGVQYYIRTSDYDDLFPNFHLDTRLGDFDIAGASQILESFLRGA